jgi:glycosyltransferase involved in cell wall biosynthesis
MKVLFLTQSSDIGGSERQLVALAKGLQNKGHVIRVGKFYNGGPLEEVLKDAGLPVINFNKSGRWDLFSFLYSLTRVVRREKPDVLHGYLPVPNILTTLLKPIFPQIKMVWGIRASNMDLSRYDWWAKFVFFWERFFSRYADMIIVNSHAGCAYHSAQGFRDDKMVVVPNGIDTNYFRPDSSARSGKRREWKITDSESVIGIVARLDPMKDHQTFLQAASILVKTNDNLRFICVGNGPEPYISKLTGLTSELGLDGRLLWAGVCKDMPATYNGFDVVVVSSSFGEGFPNVVGEAMACGIPCVVTDVGDSALIVDNSRLVVSPGNPQAMSAGVNYALSLTPGTPGIAIRETIATRFSLEQLVNRTEALLTSICPAKDSAQTLHV